jgi:hypothetical protein
MNYYAHPIVRARMAEFLREEPLSGDTTDVVMMIGDVHYPNVRKVSGLPSCLKDDLEISRPLSGSQFLLVDLDIEYVNFDCAAEPYLHPERAFALQEVVTATIEDQLLSFGIAPLHLLSGRGHHFIWQVRRDSYSFDLLRTLGHPTPTVLSHYERMAPVGGAKIGLALGTAYHGLGRVIEYLAAEIKRISAPPSKIPVELTALEVGPGVRGRDMISLDISQYGDPLDIRSVRVPYSRYLKIERQKDTLGEEMIDSLAPIFEIPLHKMSVTTALKVMRNPEAVIALAEQATSFIPDCSIGMERLISAYVGSPLANFHHDFLLRRTRSSKYLATNVRSSGSGTASAVCAIYPRSSERPAAAAVRNAPDRYSLPCARLASSSHRRADTIQVRAGLRLGTRVGRL